MSGAPCPPRGAQRFLRRALPTDVREHILGDLDELFLRRVSTHGAARARLWYWREVVSFAGRFLGERYRDRARAAGGFGGADVAGRERARGVWRGVSWLDVKLGFRMLAKYPGLTVVGALGIAVAVALAVSWFQFSRNLTDPRLPFEDGERIVRIQNWDIAAGAGEPRSLHDFTTWRAELRSIEDLAAASRVEYRVIADGLRSESVAGGRVTPSMFRLTRVPPLLGRPLVEADADPGALPTVVLGYDIWQRLFDGDPEIIGRTVRLGSAAHSVVGVMPEGFGFPVNQELWVALRDNPLDHARGQGPSIAVWGRLAEGFRRQDAQAEVTAIGVRAAADFPATNERLRPRVGPFLELDEAVFAGAANFAFILLLFVVCANVATLVFARTATREEEIALRTALGASRGRIMLQLFTEALALTSVASAIGLGGAAWGFGRGMDLFWDIQQQRPPFWFNSSLSLSAALYVALLAVFGAAVIGVIPALKTTGRRLRSRLAGAGSGGSRLRFGAVSTGVIVVQVALCVVFLPLAYLAGQEMLPDRDVAEGFPAGGFLSGRLTRQLDVAVSGLPEAERAAFLNRTAELQDEVRRRLAAEPGLSAVTFADRLPGMNHPAERIRIENDAVTADTTDAIVRTLAVDLDFFRAMDARVVAGRAFRPADLESAAGVVVIGRSFAQEVLKGRNAVGQRMRYPGRRDGEEDRWYEIVGVVEDPAMVTFGAGEYVGAYRPLVPGKQAAAQMFLRVSSNADALATRIHALVEAVDESLAVDELMSLEEIWRPVRRSNRFFIAALSAVSAIGLLLSLAGIYALMSFTVAQRGREVAIRAALGARPQRIIATIFSRALLQIGLGVLAGAVLVSLTAIKTPSGGKVVAAVAALMLTVGLLACALPAWRALRIQPADALRNSG